MKKINVSFKGNTFAQNIVVATDFWLKLTGYMFRSAPHVPGIMFQTNGIQTTFMQFELDLVFLTKNYEVVKIIRHMKPWRFTAFYFRAKWTLEVPAGLIPTDLKVGDILEVTNV